MMKMRAVTLALTGAALVAAVTTSCSGQEDAPPPGGSVGGSVAELFPWNKKPQGDDAAAGQGGEAAGQGAGGRKPGGAPVVPQPIADTSEWEKQPCELLSKQDLARLDFKPYRVGPLNAGGPGCTYDQVSLIVAKTTITTDLGGLDQLYKERKLFKLFREIDPLKGHPAVIADLKDEQRAGACTVIAGLNEKVAFRTNVRSDPKTRQGAQPCKFAADLTVLVLNRMLQGKP
jgi:hypothetical protein